MHKAIRHHNQRYSQAHLLDITDVTVREDVAAAFGERAAWEATIKALTTKEAKETNRQRKNHLRLMLLNAQAQLALHK